MGVKKIMKICNAEVGDSIFLACGNQKDVEKILSISRDKIAKDLGLVDEDRFAFCWIIDYPMFEIDEQTKKINFSHNPFSMPQGDINKINFEKPNQNFYYLSDISRLIECSRRYMNLSQKDLDKVNKWKKNPSNWLI